MMAKKVEKIEAAFHLNPKFKNTPAFTGVARSVICHNTNERYRNFKVVTLHIQNGVVVKTEFSDPYASFEIKDNLDRMGDRAVDRLNMRWEEGRTLEI